MTLMEDSWHIMLALKKSLIRFSFITLICPEPKHKLSGDRRSDSGSNSYCEIGKHFL